MDLEGDAAIREEFDYLPAGKCTGLSLWAVVSVFKSQEACEEVGRQRMLIEERGLKSLGRGLIRWFVSSLLGIKSTIEDW